MNSARPHPTTCSGWSRRPPPDDPVLTLVREQSELGVDAWTATPDWDGTRMDTDWAISVLHPGAREIEPDDVSAATPGSNVSAETPPERPPPP